MTPKHTAEIHSATASGRKLSGILDGKGDKTPAYAGPSQHLKVRNVLDEVIEGPVTAKAILDYLDCSSAMLKRLAIGEAPRKDLKVLRSLGKLTKNESGKADTWATGRYLAAIVYVYVLELRRNARSSNKGEAVAA